MMLDQLGWDYFCKTGDIDGYLLYKQAGQAAGPTAQVESAAAQNGIQENGGNQ